MVGRQTKLTRNVGTAQEEQEQEPGSNVEGKNEDSNQRENEKRSTWKAGSSYEEYADGHRRSIRDGGNGGMNANMRLGLWRRVVGMQAIVMRNVGRMEEKAEAEIIKKTHTVK